MRNWGAWVRQPTTVAGISAFIGTATALFLKQISPIAAVPVLTGAMVSILLPDNTVARKQAEIAATELMTTIIQKQGV